MQDAPSTPDGLVPVADYEKVSTEREHYRKLYLETLERCAMLERGIIAGKKAERFDGETPQLALSMLDNTSGGPLAAGRCPHTCRGSRSRSCRRRSSRRGSTPSNGSARRSSFSLGIIRVDLDSTFTVEALLKQADEAMYTHKKGKKR